MVQFFPLMNSYTIIIPLYVWVNVWMFMTSSQWSIYFIIDSNWMILMIIIIIYASVWRSIMNYLMFNGWCSIWLTCGILFDNSLLFLFGCLAKVGMFPFSLLLSFQYVLCGYNWIVFDLVMKISMLNAFVISIHSLGSIVLMFGSIFVLVNFMMFMFFVKFVFYIKHVIFISSLQWYLLILCGIYFQDELFSFYFLILYSMTTIFILWDCHINLWASFSSISTLISTHSLKALSLSMHTILKGAMHHCFYYNIHSKCPFFLTDLSNVKQWIFISSFLMIIYWMTIFSFFPTIMFLLKFIFLFLFINHSLGWAFSLVIFLVFIFQGFYIRSIGMIFQWNG